MCDASSVFHQVQCVMLVLYSTMYNVLSSSIFHHVQCVILVLYSTMYNVLC